MISSPFAMQPATQLGLTSAASFCTPLAISFGSEIESDSYIAEQTNLSAPCLTEEAFCRPERTLRIPENQPFNLPGILSTSMLGARCTDEPSPAPVSAQNPRTTQVPQTSALAILSEAGSALSGPVAGLEVGGRFYANLDELVGMDESTRMNVFFGSAMFVCTFAFAAICYTYMPKASWLSIFAGLLAGIAAVEISEGLFARSPIFSHRVSYQFRTLERAANSFARGLPGSDRGGDAWLIQGFTKELAEFGRVEHPRSGRQYDLRGFFGPRTLMPYVKHAQKSLKGAMLLPVLAEECEPAGSRELISKIEVEWGKRDLAPERVGTAIWYLARGNVSVMSWLIDWAASGNEDAMRMLREVKAELDANTFIELAAKAGYRADTPMPEKGEEPYRLPSVHAARRLIRVADPRGDGGKKRVSVAPRSVVELEDDPASAPARQRRQ